MGALGIECATTGSTRRKKEGSTIVARAPAETKAGRSWPWMGFSLRRKCFSGNGQSAYYREPTKHTTAFQLLKNPRAGSISTMVAFRSTEGGWYQEIEGVPVSLNASWLSGFFHSCKHVEDIPDSKIAMNTLAI
jgi:hypothetical protein